MIQLAEHDQCTGCSACFAVCSNMAISMIADDNGFRYPKIDSSKCKECYCCQMVCPVLTPWKPFNSEPVCYAAYNKDISQRHDSSSGGIFTIIASYVIMEGGIVFGCILQKPELIAVHSTAETIDALANMRGSKYIQSDVKDTFRECKKQLLSGRKVLFSGTPCQIAGLKHYLNKEYDNLITVEVICHGVPAPKVFDIYKKQLEHKLKCVISNFTFRNKSFSWKRILFSASSEKAKEIIIGDICSNPFGKAFLNNLCLRESCYNCACKGGKSLADISLGDFWGIENIYSEMDDDRGISAIILHNTKSIKIWETISINSIMKECKIYDILQSNSPYLQSVPMPSSRNYFISNYNRTDMATLVEKCLKTPFYKKLINILKSIVNHYGNKAKNN